MWSFGVSSVLTSASYARNSLCAGDLRDSRSCYVTVMFCALDVDNAYCESGHGQNKCNVSIWHSSIVGAMYVKLH